MNISKKIDALSETQLCLITMGVLNFIIICYITIVPAVTQLRAAQMDARQFFRTLGLAPISPYMRIYLAVSLYLLTCGCILLKRQYHDVEGNIFLLLSVYEIALVGGLLILMDMSYTGIVFFIAAEILSYVGIRKSWLYYMMAAFAIYLLCNYNLVTIVIPFNAFEVWAAFYSSRTRSYIMGVKTICEIANMMMFLMYVAYMIFNDKKEKQQVRQLNSQLSQANVELKDANQQLHDYALEKEQLGEMKERNRLAREIHDTLGHILTGISVGVDAVQVLIDISPGAAKQQLNTISEMARNGLDDVRRSVRKLKPDALETKSLDHAIYQMADEMSRTTGSKIYFVSYGSGLHYGPDEEETIYRMIQEGTTNAIRHGKASEVWIRLDKNENHVEITIKDNGVGCPDFKEGFGLTHMRERVEMLKGTIHFQGDQGFEIHAVLPIRQS